MINVKKEGILLKKTELIFEDEGVLNPGIYQEGNTVHMFYRAVREGNYSTIGYCKLEGPLVVKERNDLPLLFPQFEYESHGLEDARIVKIDDLFYMTYTAYNGINALGALATSTDLKTFKKQGIIVPQFIYNDFKILAESHNKLNEKYFRYHYAVEALNMFDKHIYLWDKNVIFFPRRIRGKLVFLHRIRPDIQIVRINEITDLTKEFWENYFIHMYQNILLESKYEHEVSYLGGGCPPIETKEGWLLIYHGVYDTPKGYVYSACAALLDLENPQKEIARLPYALFSPEFNWELYGEINNVCFPTGTAIFDERLYIYYGAADERIACASVNLNELLEELLKNKSDE